jgi:hypothetical protein
MSFEGKWVKLEIIMLCEISQARKRQILHVFAHIQNLDLKIIIVYHDYKGGLFGGENQWEI